MARHTLDRSKARRSRDPHRALAGGHTTLLFRSYRRHGDAAAREALVRRYLPLARTLAKRYARSSEPYEDLVQVASLALLKAIERFDPDRGSDFRAFAMPTILGELKRHFRDAGWSMHVPRGVQERALLVQQASERLTSRSGRAPTVPEIASEVGLTHEEALDALRAAETYDSLSLDEMRGAGRANSDGDETTLGEALGEEDARYELIEDDIAVTEAIKTLGDRERRILHLRFVKEMTQAQIAAELGVSQMQISRLLRRSLAQLRTEATGAAAEA